MQNIAYGKPKENKEVELLNMKRLKFKFKRFKAFSNFMVIINQR